MGGRVGERAKQPKALAMRSIDGQAAEGGAARVASATPKTPQKNSFRTLIRTVRPTGSSRVG